MFGNRFDKAFVSTRFARAFLDGEIHPLVLTLGVCFFMLLGALLGLYII